MGQDFFQNLLCAGYITVVLCMNLVMYLISAFYQKRLGKHSPKAGFIVAVAAGTLSIVFLFVPIAPPPADGFVVLFLLLGAAVASGINSLRLYATMRRVSK